MNYTAANAFLAKRLSVATTLSSQGISEAVAQDIRTHCFFSARVAETRILDRLRELSDAYSGGEQGLAESRQSIKRMLELDYAGVFDRDNPKITNLASTARLDLIFRQNAAMGAAVGRYEVSRDADIEERWPAWKYITGPNPRPSHAALNGRVFLKSDPIWQRVFPPWDFNCNCDVEDTDLPAEPSPRPNNVPVAESGFAFNPADAFSAGLANYDTATRAKVEQQIKQRFQGES